MRKRIFLLGLTLVSCITKLAAQVVRPPGTEGFDQATLMMNAYYEPASRVMYAVGALMGLLGAIRVYSKFSSGDQDTMKSGAAWLGGCIFLIVSATVIRAFFID